MISTQYLQSLMTAVKGKENVKVINNTSANGDDYYIKPYETTVIVNNSSSYTQDLFLPAVAESVGMLLYIAFPDAGGSNTLADQDDSYYPSWSDLTLDADGDDVLLYNTGLGWAVIFNGIA